MLIKDLKPNPKNPRTITPEKLKMLKNALTEFGDLSGIVFNRKTKQLVGGHQRTKLFDAASKITLDKTYAKPTKTGTVAEGFVELSGEKFRYREVQWDAVKEKAANLAANKGAGEWDLPELSNWLKELDDFGFDLDLTMFEGKERLRWLQDPDAVNKGDENSAWAKANGGDHEFKKGEGYITLAVHFKTEVEREKFISKNKIHVDRKLKGTWISHV